MGGLFNWWAFRPVLGILSTLQLNPKGEKKWEFVKTKGKKKVIGKGSRNQETAKTKDHAFKRIRWFPL
jgi:hypothetical protein